MPPTIPALCALAFCGLLALLAAFQLALALGAPWGRLTWGGRHPGALPARLRAGSAVSLLLYAIFGVVAVSRSGLAPVLPDAAGRIGMWVVFGVLALNVLQNLASRSPLERAVMTPVALVLALLALVLALG